MGTGNTRLVWARWVHLPDRSFRLLSYMAFRTLDEDDPPVFWGGREELAYALGRIVPPEPEPTDFSDRAVAFRRQREADFQAVKTALRPVISAGAAKVARKASGGVSAAYSLHLGPLLREAKPTPPGTTDVPLGYGKPTPGGTSDVPLRGGEGGETLQQKEEQTLEQNQEINSAKASSSPANSAEKHEKSEFERQSAALFTKYPEAREAS